jgi:hypothetical protein
MERVANRELRLANVREFPQSKSVYGVAGFIACGACIVSLVSTDAAAHSSATEASGPLSVLLRSAISIVVRDPRSIGITAVLVLSSACCWIGLALGRYVVGALAALAVLLSVALVGWSGFVMQGQQAIASSVMHLLALGLLARALDDGVEDRTKLRTAFAAGVCSAMGALFYTASWVALLPLVLWLNCCRATGAAGERSSSRLAVYAWGCGMPLVALIAVSLSTLDGGVLRAWLAQSLGERSPMLEADAGEWLERWAFVWLVGLAIAVPVAARCLERVKSLDLDGLAVAWSENGLQFSVGTGALLWLVRAPFSTAGVADLLALSGPWVGFCAGIRLESGGVERAVPSTQATIVGAPERAGSRRLIESVLSRAWLLPALAAAASLTAQHYWFVRRVGRISMDEGYVAAFAMAMVHGHWLPYVDAVSHRGPLFYWVSALAQAIFGTSRWEGIRLLSACSCLLVLIGCVAVCLIARRALAGAIAAAALAFMLIAALAPGVSMALSGEGVGMVFALAALALLTIVTERHTTERVRRLLLVAAGALCAGGALTKQTLVLVLFPLLALLHLSHFRKKRPYVWGDTASLLSGFLGAVAVIFCVYWLAGKTDALWYWLFRYNREIYMDPYANEGFVRIWSRWLDLDEGAALIWLLVLASLLAATVVATYELWMWRKLTRSEQPAGSHERSELDIAVSGLVIVSLVGAIAPMRFWWHYFGGVLPWVALLIGLRAERYASSCKNARAVVGASTAVAFAAVVIVGYAARHARLDTQFRAGNWKSPYSDPICNEIERHSNPGDRIMVWGFDGDVYVSCNRAPATKFVYSTMVLGVVPPFWHRQSDRWVAPQAREETAEAIRMHRPPIIIENRDQFAGSLVAKVPIIGAELREAYCAPHFVLGNGPRQWAVYVRKDDGCEATAR